jgi:hypothetical protein
VISSASDATENAKPAQTRLIVPPVKQTLWPCSLLNANVNLATSIIKAQIIFFAYHATLNASIVMNTTFALTANPKNLLRFVFVQIKYAPGAI